MTKDELIKVVSRLLYELSDKEDSELKFEDRKIKFSQYERIKFNEHQLKRMDITIEF